MQRVVLKIIAVATSCWILLSGSSSAQTTADLELFRVIAKGAEDGNADSQCMLAMYYARGTIVPENPKECARWILRAANQGHIGAQRTLSIFYRVGNVLDRNLVAAYMWADIAANQSNPADKAAVTLRANLQIMMKPEEIILAKTAARAFKPVKESH